MTQLARLLSVVGDENLLISTVEFKPRHLNKARRRRIDEQASLEGTRRRGLRAESSQMDINLEVLSLLLLLSQQMSASSDNQLYW